ncbi:hypothetical protein CRUP_009594 [Coryphaenoides rupestris]|nr:hypothetical protein CRUP_009594 [Coryphaenoides rupestris]
MASLGGAVTSAARCRSPGAQRGLWALLAPGRLLVLRCRGVDKNNMKIAVIGQSLFGQEVYKELRREGHTVFPRWRLKGQALPEVVAQYKATGAQLNVLPFCSQFIPMEVIDHPQHGSIIYHPSLLPRHRGASAINWTLIHGDKKGGFTVFWADDGLDTGPILLQRECDVEPDDTVNTIYKRFLFPEGVKGTTTEGATYECIQKKDNSKIDWNQPAEAIHNWIRGNDKVPGAWALVDGQMVTFYGSSLVNSGAGAKGEPLEIEGASRPGIVTKAGLVLFGNDGKTYFSSGDSAAVELTEEEQAFAQQMRAVWQSILTNVAEIQDSTDFFKSGAASMDVVRLVEEVKLRSSGCQLQNEDVEKDVNNMTVRMPHQLFINGEFVDAEGGKTYNTINPTDGTAICQVSLAQVSDVDKAVAAAKEAFEEGEWGRMNPRDRGRLLYRLADLMEQHQEELATIESLDSGAVYTLALKTHVGMSIQTFRYFAGWCDKIQGTHHPHQPWPDPNPEPHIHQNGTNSVCGIVIPWNYPLMMLAWKTAACLAAGNTVVLKPAQVTPLTAVKFAVVGGEGGTSPRGVRQNILPGSGSVVGQRLSDHPDVRKLGFTGSTEIGKHIMKSCAVSNVKKVSLELGGKSPLIIFSDCDMDKAVRMGMSSVFFNKGENCIAAGRLFVEDTIYDVFVARVVEEMKKMKVGDPLDRSTDHGPQNHKAHLDKLLEFCQMGVKEGATLVRGGKQVDRPGFFFEPTLFTGVQDHMYIAVEESFGPYGLASGVFTRDIGKALYASDRLNAGTVFVNTYNKTDVAAPFGGFKQSGFGKDLGQEALNEYLRTKTVTIEY